MLREIGLVTIRLPQNARQIEQDVLQRNRRRGCSQFGFELGTGVRTYVSATAPYVLAVALLFLAGQQLYVALAGRVRLRHRAGAHPAGASGGRRR